MEPTPSTEAVVGITRRQEAAALIEVLRQDLAEDAAAEWDQPDEVAVASNTTPPTHELEDARETESASNGDDQTTIAMHAALLQGPGSEHADKPVGQRALDQIASATSTTTATTQHLDEPSPAVDLSDDSRSRGHPAPEVAVSIATNEAVDAHTADEVDVARHPFMSDPNPPAVWWEVQSAIEHSWRTSVAAELATFENAVLQQVDESSRDFSVRLASEIAKGLDRERENAEPVRVLWQKAFFREMPLESVKLCLQDLVGILSDVQAELRDCFTALQSRRSDSNDGEDAGTAVSGSASPRSPSAKPLSPRSRAARAKAAGEHAARVDEALRRLLNRKCLESAAAASTAAHTPTNKESEHAAQRQMFTLAELLEVGRLTGMSSAHKRLLEFLAGKAAEKRAALAVLRHNMQQDVETALHLGLLHLSKHAAKVRCAVSVSGVYGVGFSLASDDIL